MDGVEELGGDVFAIDTRMGGYSDITAAYLIRGDRPCLIETGTATSTPRVRECLDALGVGPDDLATVVVTHIHLDHAGGAGDVAALYPKAEIVVHESGARHLVDPSRLVASARRVFGDAMDTVFGELQPTPADRIVTLAEVGTIDLGAGRALHAFHAPGHASHHVGLLDTQTGDLYTGDAAGVYIPETGDLRPSTPPPDFDLDSAINSIARMREALPTRLLFSHYGPVEDVATTLDRSVAELHYWVERVRESRASGLDLDHAVALMVERARERYSSFYNDEALVKKYEVLSSAAANVAGITRWLDRLDEAGATGEAPPRSSR